MKLSYFFLALILIVPCSAYTINEDNFYDSIMIYYNVEEEGTGKDINHMNDLKIQLYDSQENLNKNNYQALPGKHTIKVEAVGYEDYTAQVNVPDLEGSYPSRESFTINVKLKKTDRSIKYETTAKTETSISKGKIENPLFTNDEFIVIIGKNAPSADVVTAANLVASIQKKHKVKYKSMIDYDAYQQIHYFDDKSILIINGKEKHALYATGKDVQEKHKKINYDTWEYLAYEGFEVTTVIVGEYFDGSRLIWDKNYKHKEYDERTGRLVEVDEGMRRLQDSTRYERDEKFTEEYLLLDDVENYNEERKQEKIEEEKKKITEVKEKQALEPEKTEVLEDEEELEPEVIEQKEQLAMEESEPAVVEEEKPAKKSKENFFFKIFRLLTGFSIFG